MANPVPSGSDVSVGTHRCTNRGYELHERLPATPQSIALLRHALISLAARAGATDRQCQDIALAVSEALANAVTHAYTDRAPPGVVAVHATCHGATLEVAVVDEGVGMPPPGGQPSTGLGLTIIARAADRVELRDATPGTDVRMTFAIG